MIIYSSTDDLQSVGYVDSDFAGSSYDMMSTSGYVFKTTDGQPHGRGLHRL